MNRIRLVIGAIGVLIAAYGGWRILTTARLTRPLELGEWLIGALVVHDALLAPLTALFGIGLHRVMARRAPRAGRYVAGVLVVAAMVVVVGVPLIHRRGHTPSGSTLEARNYGGGLAVILGVVVAFGVFAYVIRVVRDRRRSAARMTDHPRTTVP